MRGRRDNHGDSHPVERGDAPGWVRKSPRIVRRQDVFEYQVGMLVSREVMRLRALGYPEEFEQIVDIVMGDRPRPLLAAARSVARAEEAEKALHWLLALRGAVARGDARAAALAGLQAGAYAGELLLRASDGEELATKTSAIKRKGREAQAAKQREPWALWQRIADGLPRGHSKQWAALRVLRALEEVHGVADDALPDPRTVARRITYRK